MTNISIWDIKQEVVVFIRNQDIVSISDRGVTTSQDTGTFTAANSHTLATNPTLVKNVRNVDIGGSDLDFGVDYTVSYVTGVISFTTPQTGAYTIDYDQGSTDRIFPDFPQKYLKLNQFPRVAAEIIDAQTKELALGGGSTMTNFHHGSNRTSKQSKHGSYALFPGEVAKVIESMLIQPQQAWMSLVVLRPLNTKISR